MPTSEIIENAIYSTEELSELFDISHQNMRLLIKRGISKELKLVKTGLLAGNHC